MPTSRAEALAGPVRDALELIRGAIEHADRLRPGRTGARFA